MFDITKKIRWEFNIDSLQLYQDDIINDKYTSTEDILANNIHILPVEQEIKTNINTRISDEDLDTMAQIFYLHKQNLEKVSYIHPEEEVENDEFFECEQNNKEVKREFHSCEEWDNTMH